jgi:hypothetical protein
MLETKITYNINLFLYAQGMADDEPAFELQATEHTSHYIPTQRAVLFVLGAISVILLMAVAVAAILR